MSLLTPEPGLVFWMLIAFGIVVFILVKFGFPVIIKSVNTRNAYIDDSLLAAKKAHDELATVKKSSEALIGQTRHEQGKLIEESAKTRDQMIEMAKVKAKEEADKIISSARIQIQAEKENALREVRSEIALLSIDIAEKVLRQELDKNEKQMSMIDRLLDEIEISKS
ncbi:MAG: F0F1 ATP synthase subunit B [Dysgonamonadaceae bacterium]